jgi:hypothetical protein
VTVAAALHGGTRRRARVLAVLGIRKGANGAARMRGAKANQNRAMWRRCSAAEGSPRWSSSGAMPACTVPAAAAGYDLLHPAQKGQERALVLTEGSDCPEKQRMVAGGEVRAAGMGRSGEEAAAEVFRALGLHGSTRGVPAEVLLGSRGSGEPPAARDRGGGANYRWQRLVQFRPLHRPGSQVKASGSFLAPRRSCCGGWQGRRCSGAAGPRWCRELCAEEQGGGGARASMAAVGFRVRAQGGWGVGDPICRAAGHPQRAGPTRGLTGDLGGLGRVGEEGNEEKEALTSGAEWLERERERAQLGWLEWAAGRGEERGRRAEHGEEGRGIGPRGREPAQGGERVFLFLFLFLVLLKLKSI